MKYKCRICGEQFEEVPDDAVLLTEGRGRGHRQMVYRFSNGSIHALRKVQAPSLKQHELLHKRKPKIGCEHCYGPPPRSLEEQLNELKQAASQRIPQEETKIEPVVEGASSHESRSSAAIQALLQSKKDQPDTTALAASLRRAWNHEEEESEWNKDSIAKI